MTVAPDACRRGHPWPANLHQRPTGGRCCLACQRARKIRQHDAEYAARHAGHDIAETQARRLDGRPCRRCLTCSPPSPNAWHPPVIDEVTVRRAVSGDRPERLTIGERRAAIAQLRSRTLPAPVIAEHVGCSERTVWRTLARLADAA